MLRQALNRLEDTKEQLTAADALIAAQTDELAASEKAREAARIERESLQRIVDVQEKEVVSLRSAIDSQRLASQALREQVDVERREVERQKRKVSSANKRTIIFGVLALIGGIYLGRR